jgi:FlaA1/EpsC-like NDP-sugar epimerase
MYSGSNILVTGGTGSWGRHLVQTLLQKFNPREIRIFSRGEHRQVEMEREIGADERVRFIIGDVRDYEAVLDACRGVDIVFHLAALKHVPICERQPDEAFRTNVLGTENVIRAAIAQRVAKVVDVSTDKAVDPVNVYGMTKAIAEKLTLRANRLTDATRFVCIRGGNVLGTNGSVVPFFLERIRRGEDLPITHPEMTRYFMTLPEAIGLLLRAAEAAIGGETFVIRMPACRIRDLAEVMIERSGAAVKIREIGIREGEKLHETLVSAREALHARHYDDDVLVILPPSPDPELARKYADCLPTKAQPYRSDDELLDKAGIARLLDAGGF